MEHPQSMWTQYHEALSRQIERALRLPPHELRETLLEVAATLDRSSRNDAARADRLRRIAESPDPAEAPRAWFARITRDT